MTHFASRFEARFSMVFLKAFRLKEAVMTCHDAGQAQESLASYERILAEEERALRARP